MAKTIEFFFDVGSPTAYLAFTQLPAIAARHGAALVYRPMLLGGVFQSTGNQSPVMVEAKGKWMFHDLNRWAAHYGVPYQRNPHFPINTLALMRGAAGLQATAPDRFLPYLNAVFHAMWVEPKNLNDPAEIGKVLVGAGFDPEAFMAMIGQQAVKDALKRTTEEAVSRGVFGAPTMFVGDEMHFGQDRLDWVERAVARAD